MADPTFETAQATGAQTQMIYAGEADWGLFPNSGCCKLNVVAGESLDDTITTFQSKVIGSTWKKTAASITAWRMTMAKISAECSEMS